MKRTGVIFLIMLLSVALVASLNSQMVKADASIGGWTKAYGGTNSDEAYDLVQTGDGGYALAGITESYGAGGQDFWLVKTDASGNAQWNKTYGGTNDDRLYGKGLVQAGDGGYALAGYTYSYGAGGADFWLVKTDSTGNAQWNKTYGGTNDDEAYALVQTSDGGYAIAGSTYSFGAGGGDFWLVKTDASGNELWNKTYGGIGSDTAYALVKTGDGGYAIAGSTHSYGAGSWDFWLVKADSAGNIQWNKTYGGTDFDWAYALVQTGDGGYALAGMYCYDVSRWYFWLVKTDSDGNELWNETYAPFGSDTAYALVKTGDGGYAIAGFTGSHGDFLLVKIDASGKAVGWSRTFGVGSLGWANALVQTSDGGYAVAGGTESYGAGCTDFWLVKTDANGMVPEFPSPMILAVLLIVTSSVVILAKRKFRGSKKRPCWHALPMP